MKRYAAVAEFEADLEDADVPVLQGQVLNALQGPAVSAGLPAYATSFWG